MMYFLDTSVIIDLLRGNPVTMDFFSRHETDIFVTSAVCAYELFCGVEQNNANIVESKRAQVQKILSSLSEIFPFEIDDGQEAGSIYADLSKRGELIGDMDICIAASALRVGAVLVTENPKHFTRVKQLEVITPESA